MVRITQLKLPITHTEHDLVIRAAKLLRLPEERILSWRIVKQSVDARKKPLIQYIYTLDVEVEREEKVVKRAGSPQVTVAEEKKYRFPQPGQGPLKNPPVIIGSGPAGLFCGYMLARAGYCPVILEQGEDVDNRRDKVELFWLGGQLDLRTNVQFGEGGAGTFSDGKLNTMVKDPVGRNQEVLRILAEHGADSSILYVNKPHIGTDVLSNVVKNIRNHIIQMGGRVVFGAKMTNLEIRDGRVRGVRVACRPQIAETGFQGLDVKMGYVSGWTDIRQRLQYTIFTEQVVLAVGHSARDTFVTLFQKGIPMQQKSFAVGLRIQHPQKMIDESQYGFSDRKRLGPADYKVTYQTGSGRGVYSFCMCPGGYVVNASSENECLAVNGMSYHARAGLNANSALIVTVTPADFGGNFPLAGVAFQRNLEKLAYTYGSGNIPVQLLGDFREGKESRDWGDVSPECMGDTQFANLREILPSYISEAIIGGTDAFEGKIRGFSRYDSILAGVESRTSSPLRILRDENLESSLKGLFPCGEGAGYAGGITSAAMDGIKVAEEIGRRYMPLQTASERDA